MLKQQSIEFTPSMELAMEALAAHWCAGHREGWTFDVLTAVVWNRLVERGMVTIEPGETPTTIFVTLTEAGLTAWVDPPKNLEKEKVNA